MKTRTGFVSNSSSSSFVIVGIDLQNDIDLSELNLKEQIKHSGLQLTEKAKEYLEEESWYEFFEEELGMDIVHDDGLLIVGGRLFMDVSDDIEQFDLKELEENIEKAKKQVKEFMEKTGITAKIKIFSGIVRN